MDSGLNERIVDKINGIFRGYPEVKRVILYGSRAMGNYRNGSDIDLVIEGDGVTHSMRSRIENSLDDLLLPYKIDLSLRKEIDNPELLDHIRRVGVVFYDAGSST